MLIPDEEKVHNLIFISYLVHKKIESSKEAFNLHISYSSRINGWLFYVYACAYLSLVYAGVLILGTPTIITVDILAQIIWKIMYFYLIQNKENPSV